MEEDRYCDPAVKYFADPSCLFDFLIEFSRDPYPFEDRVQDNRPILLEFFCLWGMRRSAMLLEQANTLLGNPRFEIGQKHPVDTAPRVLAEMSVFVEINDALGIAVVADSGREFGIAQKAFSELTVCPETKGRLAVMGVHFPESKIAQVLRVGVDLINPS